MTNIQPCRDLNPVGLHCFSGYITGPKEPSGRATSEWVPSKDEEQEEAIWHSRAEQLCDFDIIDDNGIIEWENEVCHHLPSSY